MLEDGVTPVCGDSSSEEPAREEAEREEAPRMLAGIFEPAHLRADACPLPPRPLPWVWRCDTAAQLAREGDDPFT
jgi:hypothetical protein